MQLPRMVSRAWTTQDQHKAPCPGDSPSIYCHHGRALGVFHECLCPGPISSLGPSVASQSSTLRMIPELASLPTLHGFRILFHIHAKSIIFLACVHPLHPALPHSGSEIPVPSSQNCLRRRRVPDTSLLSAGGVAAVSQALLYCWWGRFWAFSSLENISTADSRVTSRSFILPAGLLCGSLAHSITGSKQR